MRRIRLTATEQAHLEQLFKTTKTDDSATGARRSSWPIEGGSTRHRPRSGSASYDGAPVAQAV